MANNQKFKKKEKSSKYIIYVYLQDKIRHTSFDTTWESLFKYKEQSRDICKPCGLYSVSGEQNKGFLKKIQFILYLQSFFLQWTKLTYTCISFKLPL